MAIEDMLSLCVAGIADGMDREQYLVWATHALLQECGHTYPFAGMPVDVKPRFANMFARQVWNVTPIPGKGFRRDPHPVPGRNEPCPCGSGRKYKRCCIDLPEVELTKAIDVWPLLLEVLSPKQLDEAVA